MKNLEFVLLLDCYGSLLTERQRDLLDGYYNEDLSLAELAEPRGISRQAVHDSIRRGERQLQAFETQMGLAERLRNCQKLFADIEALAKMLPDADAELAEKIAKTAQNGMAIL